VKPVYRDVKASGVRLRVTELGSGHPLLLLHGALLDRSSWDHLLEPLGRHFRVIAPDLPGFGESEKPAESRFGYSVADFTHVVTDLFAGLRIGQAHVVGHALGGAIALNLASSTPELVSKLLLVDAQCYQTPPDPFRRIAGLPLLGGLLFKQLMGKTMFSAYFKEYMVAGHRGIASERLDHYYQAFNSPSARNSALLTLRNTADNRTVEVRLPRIAVPSLVLWGRHDAISPAGFGQRLAKEIPHAGFRLLDAGHTPLEEDPEQLAADILGFCMKGTSGPPASTRGPASSPVS